MDVFQQVFSLDHMKMSRSSGRIDFQVPPQVVRLQEAFNKLLVCHTEILLKAS